MLKYSLLAMLLIILSSATVSCLTTQVKDKEVCADLGGAGSECAHTYITKRTALKKMEWDKKRVGWMCMSAADFSDTEDVIDELCRAVGCDFQAADQVSKMKVSMSPLVLKAKSAAKNN